MKYLLYKPYDNCVVEINGTSNFSGAQDKVMPWSLGVLAALLRGQGHEVSILDSQALELSFENALAKIKRIAPDHIIAPIHAVCFRRGTAVLRSCNIPITILINEPFKEWCESRASGMDVVFGDWMSFFNKAPLAIKDYPLPAFDLLPMELYSHQQMLVSEGCNHHCSFCHFGKLIPRGWSARPINHVIEEIRILRSYGLRFIRIMDNELGLNKQYAKALFSAIIDADLDIYFETNTRVSNVDEELVALLAEAGCIYTGYGVECAVQDVLDLNHKAIQLSQIIEADKLFKKYGIPARIYTLLGLKGQSEREVQTTMRFVFEQLQSQDTTFDLVIPFPGTEYHNDLLSAGKISEAVTPAHIAWVEHNVYANPFVQGEDMERPCWNYDQMSFASAVELEFQYRSHMRTLSLWAKLRCIFRHPSKGIRFAYGQLCSNGLGIIKKICT